MLYLRKVQQTWKSYPWRNAPFIRSFFSTDISWIFNARNAKPKLQTFKTHALFFISNNFITNARLKLAKKVKQILSNTLRLNFWYLKIIRILHPRYHPKIIGHILNNSQKKKYVCIHETMRLIIMKIKIKMKNRSHRYDISRPRSRQEQNYSKYKVSMVMLICIN